MSPRASEREEWTTRLAAALATRAPPVSPAWARSVVASVRQWRNFLRRQGLSSDVSPTKPLVAAFAQELQARYRPATVDTYLLQIQQGLAVLAPDCPLDGLARQRKRLAPAPTKRERQTRLAPDDSSWPAEVRARWETSFGVDADKDDPYADVARVALWSCTRQVAVGRSYSMYLRFLVGRGSNNVMPSPASVGAWLADLSSRRASANQRPLAAASIATYLERLLAMARNFIGPDRDWQWFDVLVQRLKNHATTAPKAKNKFARVVEPSELEHLARTLLKEARTLPPGITAAVRHRDGLMILVLAKRAPRLSNLAAIRVGTELMLPELGGARLVFSAQQTKARRPFNVPIEVIRKEIDEHIRLFRPYLGGASNSTGLFLSTHGGAISACAISRRVGDIVSARLGVRVSPHLFRDSLATFLADWSEASSETAMTLLHHADERAGGPYRAHARQLRVQEMWDDVLADYDD